MTLMSELVSQYKAGKLLFYRPVAVLLRMLCCDTTRRHGQVLSIALIPQIFPDLLFPALEQPDTVIPLETWLKQEVGQKKTGSIPLQELIRLVVDRGAGAHYDPAPGFQSAFEEYAQQTIIRAAENILSVIQTHQALN
jgi:hypothetical protein